MRAKTPLVLALLLAALIVPGCGGDDDDEDYGAGGQAPAATSEGGASNETSRNAPAPSGEAVRAAKVKIVDFAYSPDPVRVQVGGKVIWQNEDPESHTATAEDGSFDTGTIDEGKLKSETFKKAGTYAYVCSIHPQMHGTVEVVEKG